MFKDLTTREKVILVGAGIALGVVTGVCLKLKIDNIKCRGAYNALANNICLPGAWKAVDASPGKFKLVRAVVEDIIL